MSAPGILGGRSVAVWARQLRVMTIKELLQLGRDTALALFFVYAFTLDIYLAGAGVGLDLRNAALYVIDGDHSFASRELIHRFRLPYFQLRGELTAGDEATRLLDQGEAMIVLEIPERFQESLRRGEPTSVQMQVDATNSVVGFLAASYGAQIVGRFGAEAGPAGRKLSGDGLRVRPLVRSDHRVWYNPNLNQAWFMSISELLTVITMFAILLPAAAMTREKERGTVEQLLVSPLTPFQITFPKVLAMNVVIVAGTAVSVFGVMQPFLHLPIKGSLALFFGLTSLYAFTTAGLGLFVSTFARNLAQAGMLSLLIVAPMILLSGAWTPPEAMPHWLRFLMRLSPLYYFIEASYGVLLRGAGLAVLWDAVLGIALLGGAAFGFGVRRFRRQFR